MNGKLKVVLKLPKSLQQGTANKDSAAAQPVKKRKRPEEHNTSHTVAHQSSQAAQKSEGPQERGHPPKKSKFVVKLPSGGQGANSARSQEQPPSKPRLTVKYETVHILDRKSGYCLTSLLNLDRDTVLEIDWPRVLETFRFTSHIQTVL